MLKKRRKALFSYIYNNTEKMKLKDLLNEAYGSQKLGQDLQSWASENNVAFAKISAQKKPASYGGSISDTLYRVGIYHALVRYVTVPGAPRLNELKMWLLDGPEKNANVIASKAFIEDFRYVKDILVKYVLPTSKMKTRSNNTWDKAKIDRLIRDLSADKQYRSFNDAEAFEVAQSILDDHPGLEDAVKSIYRIQDVQGWLANKI